MKSFFRKLKWLVARPNKEAELQDELQFHLDEEAEERQAAGLAEDQAHWAARRELGNISLVRENTRSAWGWTMLEQFGQDLRYALRMMSHNKGFCALAILSLALGIGANTAIYSFMDSLLLRSLPVSNPESLVVLNWRAAPGRNSVVRSMSGNIYGDAKSGPEAGIFPYPVFELVQKSDAVFSTVFAYYRLYKVNVMVNGEAELASGEYVSGDYFRGLDVVPVAGRGIIPDDDRMGAPGIAVLSFEYAKRRFTDPATAPGKSILINSVPFTVAGVAPPGFFGVDPASAPAFYLPMHNGFLLERDGPENLAKGYLDRNYYWIQMMARMRPGVTLIQAQAVLGPIFHQWVASTAVNDQQRARLPELQIKGGATGLDSLRREYSKPLYVLLAMVGLILAIACANIANLLLSRAAARRREMAVRLSMGAGRFRVIRQLLTESVLLASIGGVMGVLFAIWGMRFLTLLLANGDESFTLHPDLNWHVLGVAVALSILTGLLFGLAPALQSTRVDVMPALKETRAGQPGGRRSFWRPSLTQVLVVSQIAISLLMLVAAGLFTRTLSNLQSIELGFNRENLLLFQMNARQAGHKNPEITTFYSDLQKRFAAIPGVRGASVSQSPLLGQGTWMGDVVPVGKEVKGTTHILMTGTDFFSTMQIPLTMGRAIDEHDQAGSPAVAVVSEEYAKVNFGDQSPLGQRLVVGRHGRAGIQVEIVGVARNIRYGAIKGAFRPVVYLPFTQGSYHDVDDMTFALRTGGDPMRYVHTVREIVRQADSRIPVTEVKTEAAQVDQVMNQEIIFARLCTGFAILALAIACVGLYGTMAYTVARRTSEIGIRMALGAQRATVVWMVLGEVLVVALVGLAISVPTALGTSKFVASFLFGVKPNDPWAMAFAIAILLSAALLAGYVPARRASRIDPMAALRHE